MLLILGSSWQDSHTSVSVSFADVFNFRMIRRNTMIEYLTCAPKLTRFQTGLYTA